MHFFIEIKEIVVGSATSSILYNLFSKEIMIVPGLESYETWHFHKHGSPNNTSKLQDEQHHTISHPWGSWCYMEENTFGWCGDITLGEATRWCTVMGVVWMLGPTASWPLSKWSSPGFHYRQWTAVDNPSPTSVSGSVAPTPLDLCAQYFGSWWWKCRH